VQGSALLAPETRIRLWVNEELRQNATVADMIWSVPEIIAHLSSSVEIRPGDLVYTGTPAGVGPLVPGDFCVVEIDSLGRVMNRIGERQP
jgi:fumarylpyruvate hydrolase